MREKNTFTKIQAQAYFHLKDTKLSKIIIKRTK
jgi:hypothetical protein